MQNATHHVLWCAAHTHTSPMQINISPGKKRNEIKKGKKNCLLHLYLSGLKQSSFDPVHVQLTCWLGRK